MTVVLDEDLIPTLTWLKFGVVHPTGSLAYIWRCPLLVAQDAQQIPSQYIFDVDFLSFY